MKLESQVCSLELAERLKELGVKQESLYAYYGNAGKWNNTLVDNSIYDDVADEFRDTKLLSAFTVAELGEMLPVFTSYKLKIKKISGSEKIQFEIFYEQDGKIVSDIITYETEADARAKMLIYLLENKLITL